MKKNSVDMDELKKRRKQVEIEYPDREPDEEPITQKQISYIKHLSPNLRDKDLSGLGTYQASAIIDEILAEKEDFTDELVDEVNNKSLSKNKGCLSSIMFCMVLIIILVYFIV
jgi:hypothetical protein